MRYSVSIVGTAYGNRISLVHYLKKQGIAVETFGAGWPGGFLPADRFQEIYCASQVNLNFDDIGFTHYQCGKIRDFEIPMCGALMLCTHNDHLKNYFELDLEIFTFRTPDECLRQVRRLLLDEDLCKTARVKSRERALREHTWEKRVGFLLTLIGLSS
jgi:spore maturation protein CgeB